MIFLLRHGQIAARLGRTFVGQSDLPLDDEGRRQALLWRRAFAGLRFERAFTSDLARCRETTAIVLGHVEPVGLAEPTRRDECADRREAAGDDGPDGRLSTGPGQGAGCAASTGPDEENPASQPAQEAGDVAAAGRSWPGGSSGPNPGGPTARPAGPRPESLPELREISLGAWEGLTAEEVRRRFPGQWEARGRDILGARPEGGESFADLRERVVPAFEAIVASAGSADALVTAHAGVNRIILCHVLGLEPARLMRLGQDYGALNLIGLDSGSPRLLGLNLRPGSWP